MLPHSRRTRYHDGKDGHVEALRQTECTGQKCGLYAEQGALRKDHYMISRRDRRARFAKHPPKRARTVLGIDRDVAETLHHPTDSWPAENFTTGDEPQWEGQCTETERVRHALMQGDHETGTTGQALEPPDSQIDIEVAQQSRCGGLLRCRDLPARRASRQPREATQLSRQQPSAPCRQFQTISPTAADHPRRWAARRLAWRCALAHRATRSRSASSSAGISARILRS